MLSKIINNAKPGVCMDVAEWATKTKRFHKIINPAVIAEVEKCLGGDDEAIREFEKHKPVLVRPQTLTLIEGAIIRDQVGFVELPDGQICYEGNWWLPYLTNHPAYKRRFARNLLNIKGNVYSFLCFWAAEYYHWFHDVLPRLETSLPHLPSDTRFLINSNPKKWQLDSLAAFGINVDRLVFQPAIAHTKIENLWFSTPIGHCSLGSGKMVKIVSDRLKKHFGVIQAPKNPRRFYISRRKAQQRRVVNEDEIRPELEQKHFEIVYCEDYSLAEQIRMFASAEAVMGPHGAGFLNMIFSDSPNAKIIELNAMIENPPCYLVLANQFGFKFWRPEGVEAEQGLVNDMKIQRTKFKIGIDSFE